MTQIYTQADECTHDHDDDPMWQESYFFCWYDERAGIGGVQRVAHAPNQRTTNYWNGLFTADGFQYRSDVDGVPLGSDDRGVNYLQSSGQRITYGGGENNRLEFDEDDVKVDLRFDDFYPICEAWAQGEGGQAEQDICRNHYESSGRVTGTVQMRDRHFDVDGLYHRDHSWGPRDWEGIAGHRWIVGTAGPELSISGTVMFVAEDLCSGGFVMRNGERTKATAIDYVVGVEPDGVTARNATVTFTLETGEELILDCEPFGGVMMGHGLFVESDQLSRFTVRDEGITGICNVEMSTNHRLHNRPVTFAIGSALKRGFSQNQGRHLQLNEKFA